VAATSTAAPSAAASATPSATPSASASASATASPAAGNGAGSGYLHDETTINYSVSQTVQHIITQPGVVKKLSVAVFVDQAALGKTTVEQFQTSIAAAIGADPTRGDVVAVQAVSFAAQASSVAPIAASASPDMISTVGGMSGTILGAVFALIMLLLFWLNMGSLKKRADEAVYDLGPSGPMPSFAPMPNRAGIPATTTPDAPAAADVPVATPQARIQERLRLVADERPDALVGLMHGWLREEDRRR
jgi:flagellar M-ring protein FliF